jgi:membrane associated rhomboid family serine protease
MFPVRDTVPRQGPPVATWILIIANGVVFLFELGVPVHMLERVFYVLGIVPARFMHPDWAAWAGIPVDGYWPFLTSQFLHGSWVHVIANMWTLWIFGDNVEDRMGALRFSLFYLTCGIAAGLVHCLVNPDSTIPAVGASGAIAGVMGAYFLLFPAARVVVLVPVLFVPFFFEVPAVTYLVVWAVAQVFSGTLAMAGPGDVGGVAWWAHAGGFLTGLVLQFVFVDRGRASRPVWRDEYGPEAAWVPPGHWRRRS